MANNEDYLDALTAFSRNTSREIPPILEQYLNGVAKNGETIFQWSLLKPLIVGKMEQVIEELRQGLSSENIPQRPNVENVRFEVMQARIMDALHKFNGAPFTIQRLCELLVDPKRHYKRSDKFMRGLEKNVLVVSTVDPYGRKVVSESGTKHLVNGMDTNGSPFFPRDSNISSNLPPVPGWVTTTVTMATHAQNTPDVTSEQKPAQQNSSQDSPVTTSSSSTSLALVSSLYADQGEQPPTVHAEEVVEETVVTMDTNEAGSVAVDGGEAMAVDAEEEEMGGDDTNASSSSSSSTSSEELSTPDTGESLASVEDRTMTVSSSSQMRARPWASIASEGEEKGEPASSSADLCPSPATDSTDTSEPLPAAEPSPDSPSNKQVDHPSSSDTSSTQPEPTLTDSEDVANSIAEPVTESLPDTLPEPEKVLDSSFGFTESTSTSSEAVTEPQDSQSSEPSIDDSARVASDSPESSTTGSDEFIPPSATTDNTQTSPPHSYEPSSSPSSSNTTDSHAEVSASSSTDSQPRDDISSDIITDECDSVAGLERLVHSVDSSPSPDEHSSVSSGSPKSACSLSAEASHKTEQSDSSPMSSSLDSSMNCDEPQAKQRRLSDDSPSSLLSSTEAATSESVSSEADASSSSKTDGIADTTSDSVCEASAPPSAWNQNSNIQESHEMVVSCSGSGSDSAATPADEPQDQEKDTSPVSPKSSEDSLGFGDFEGAATENLVGEKQAEELVKEETGQEECEDKSALPEHEAMDQD